MRKKRKKSSLRSKIRIFLALLVFGTVILALGGNCLSNIISIRNMQKEKKELETKLISLKEEKEELESDILRLNDSDYIAKYVREKYYFSKDGELILKMDE